MKDPISTSFSTSSPNVTVDAFQRSLNKFTADQIAKGEEFEKKAEKKISGWSLFGSKYEHSAEFYEKAANCYKACKSWDKAAGAYIKLAGCHLKLGLEGREFSKYKAASAFMDAAYSYENISVTGAISCYDHAVNQFIEIGKFDTAALLCQTIGKLYEVEQDFEKSIVYVKRAAELFQSEKNSSSARECKHKVAQFYAQLEQFPRAIEIYEDLAKQSLNRNPSGYWVKSYLLNAGLCQLCKGGTVALSNALEHYKELDLTFSGTFEYKFLSDLAASVDEKDVLKFADVVKNFDSTTKLDAWKAILLLKVKEKLIAKEMDGLAPLSIKAG